MNLQSLKYFIAVTEYSSFTKAAERFHVTQPTLSRQIADMERKFGVQLFYRDRQSVTLTPAGEACLPAVKEIVARCENLMRHLKNIRGEVSGMLKIGYFWCLDQDFFSKPLSLFAETYPNINVGLTKASFSGLIDSLMDGSFDLIYAAAAGLVNIPNISTTKVAKSTLQLIVPKDHPLSDRNSIHISELKDEQFIMLERSVSPHTVDGTIQMCLKNGFSPKVAYYTQDTQTMILMVCAGKGVAFVPSIKQGGDTTSVKYLPLEGCDLDCNIVIAHKKDNQNPAIPLFISQACGRGIDSIEAGLSLP